MVNFEPSLCTATKCWIGNYVTLMYLLFLITAADIARLLLIYECIKLFISNISLWTVIELKVYPPKLDTGRPVFLYRHLNDLEKLDTD